MDVHVRGIKERVWKQIRIAAFDEGITVAQLIEGLWATKNPSSPRATRATKSPKKKIHNNAVESIKKRKIPELTYVPVGQGKQTDEHYHDDPDGCWEDQDGRLYKGTQS